MPTKYFIAVLLSFISLNILAQSKFVPGYTISPTKDTIHCLIKFEDWVVSPDKIEIRDPQSQSVETVSSQNISEFHLETENETYISKKIGVLDINLNQDYKLAPSLETSDSVVVFLRQITTGPKATLLEYLNVDEDPHYFLETSNGLKELFYYQFYRVEGSKKFPLQIENYKVQLRILLPELKPESSLPWYTENSLRKFIDKYNYSGIGEHPVSKNSTQKRVEVDISFGIGLENWEEIRNKITYGFGLRLNLPQNFHNRYLRFSYMFIPAATEDYLYRNSTKKIKSHSIEMGIGTYFGLARLRPNIGFDIMAPDRLRYPMIGPHVGLSYKRILTVELSHFANIFSFVSHENSKVNFLNKPRIILTYYQNLNKLIVRK